jgi:DNA-binding CsgD family transcriptional regulator
MTSVMVIRAMPVNAAHENRLAVDVLTVALALSLWVAVGSLVLAAADGFGSEAPARRALIGCLLVAGSAAMLARRLAVARALVARPWLVVPIGVTEVLLAVIDEPIGGPYVAFSLTSVGLAVVAADSRTVWTLVAALVTTYVAGVLVTASPAELSRQGDLGGVIGAVLSYVFAAFVLLGLRWQLQRYERDVVPFLESLRAGNVALPAPLTRAVLPTLPPPPPAPLTPAEITVVEALAAGLAPKVIARELGVAIATVRSHLANARRKTGTHTLPELAALTARPDWPHVEGADE